MRNAPRSIVAAAFLSAVCVSLASAQAQAHKRTPGDTLRLMQTSKMTQEMDGGAMGSASTAVNAATRIVVLFGAGDTITAWLDSATSQVSGPTGDMAPDMSDMLNKRKVVTLSSSGEITIVREEDLLSPELAAMSEMMPKSLFGLELKLPNEPLRKGLTWTDTIDAKSAPGAQNVFANRGVGSHEVVGDSAIAGHAVLIIESTGTSELDMTVSIAQVNGTVSGKTLSTTKARSYYAPALALILKRSVVLDSKGAQEISGDVSMSMNLTQHNEEQTTLIH